MATRQSNKELSAGALRLRNATLHSFFETGAVLWGWRSGALLQPAHLQLEALQTDLQEQHGDQLRAFLQDLAILGRLVPADQSGSSLPGNTSVLARLAVSNCQGTVEELAGVADGALALLAFSSPSQNAVKNARTLAMCTIFLFNVISRQNHCAASPCACHAYRDPDGCCPLA
jgi:hypothetical protein